MGAGISLMKLENIRILKDMRNSVNRKVNCETANINKTVHAALKQAEDIRYIRDTRGLSSLPEGLEEIAELRLEFPKLSERTGNDAETSGGKIRCQSPSEEAERGICGRN